MCSHKIDKTEGGGEGGAARGTEVPDSVDCARDTFVYKPGLATTRGCNTCTCGDGSRMCGCTFCPEIVPQSGFFLPIDVFGGNTTMSGEIP